MLTVALRDAIAGFRLALPNPTPNNNANCALPPRLGTTALHRRHVGRQDTESEAIAVSLTSLMPCPFHG